MNLKLYNTLTRKKEIFKPIKQKEVGMWTCGPTVYQYAHIGNLRTYIFEDILKRALLYNKYKVKHVMNITDVGHLTSDADTGEDKIEKASKKEKKSVWKIAEFYTKAFKQDIKRLNILEPNIWCKATDHIKEQIQLVKKIEEKGFTYEIKEDGIYFNTSKLKDYGKLANLNLKHRKERVHSKDKKHPTDFALWKFSPKDKKRQMEWSSPWSPKGFPGWHIECSAMAMKYLGNNFDIHCGGIDLIPIHHTNEIAQIESTTGKKWVNYWIHGEFVILDKKKMAKSEGNFLTLQDLIDKKFNPLDYRYLCLTSHYRKPLNFSWEALETAKNSYDNLKEKIREIKTKKDSKNKEKIGSYEEKFLKENNNDLNTPKSLAILWAVIKDNNLGSKEKNLLVQEFDKVLGLNLIKIEKEKLSKDALDLIKEREKARKEKNYKKADIIRERLKKKGLILEDTKEGTKIKQI